MIFELQILQLIKLILSIFESLTLLRLLKLLYLLRYENVSRLLIVRLLLHLVFRSLKLLREQLVQLPIRLRFWIFLELLLELLFRQPALPMLETDERGLPLLIDQLIIQPQDEPCAQLLVGWPLPPRAGLLHQPFYWPLTGQLFKLISPLKAELFSLWQFFRLPGLQALVGPLLWL